MTATMERRLEWLTSVEVRAAVAAGWTTVIVPSGAIEQHGPHLPLAADAIQATELGQRVAELLGNCLIAPTIQVGCSDHHMAFAGTISLDPTTLSRVYQDYCRSLSRHGFRTILCFSAHGGNFEVLKAAEAGLNESVQPDCRVIVFADLDAYMEVWRSTVDDMTGLGDQIGGHADIAETSLMMAIQPDAIRAQDMQPGYTGPMGPPQRERVFREGVDTISENGVLGDPRGATNQLGAECLKRLTELLTEYFHARMSESTNGDARVGHPEPGH